MKKFFLFTLPLVYILSACGYKDGGDSYWQADSAWYKSSAVPDSNFIDVFYIASTEVVKSTDKEGNEDYRANLTPDEKALITRELEFVNAKIYPDSINLFSPYTHQYTLNAVMLPKERFDSVTEQVATEVCEAFDYYMEHFNGGRRFIIAGFSQGGQMTLALLKHITDEQYSRMVAAYMLGYGVSANDLKCSHVKPAQCATDKGVTISFNSVSDLSNMWNFVMNDAAVCINPVNWTTTSEPADFSYHGQNLTAVVDTVNNVLIVNGFKEDPMPIAVPWPEGNLHHYDLMFYTSMIKENTLKRSR
ncbi:MAG: DUF3089 domain-containing protein [Paludibacteraceae bacterium]|nr:DUF3089 domain-containing protein [Paludibacteraceae bacterium]